MAKIDPKTIEGLYLFDEGAGNVAKDSGVKGLNGKFTGNPKWVAGKFGKALEFDGKSYVTIPDHQNPTDALTVSAWVKSATPGWNQHGWMVEKRDAYILHPNQGGVNVAFPLCNGACWNQPFNWDTGSVGPKDITEWHMYTGTYDSKTGDWRIYIDAKVESKLSLNKTKINVDPGPIHIGWDECCGGSRFGTATMDEVAIFNVALSEADVQSLMKGFEAALAVEPANKLTATWAGIKTQY
jgi:hypothetical protein